MSNNMGWMIRFLKRVKLIVELYGAQIIGHTGSGISKRIDIIATAIHNNYRVSQLNDIDLTYTPPLSSPWEPVQMAAQKWTTINKGNREK